MKKLKKVQAFVLSILLIFSLIGCANSSYEIKLSEVKAKKAEYQDKYIGKYNLLSIGGDESIPNNYKFHYIELEPGGLIIQKAEPIKEKGLKIYCKGTYVLMEDNSIKIRYDNLEEYIQSGTINNKRIEFIDVIDRYDYVYELED